MPADSSLAHIDAELEKSAAAHPTDQGRDFGAGFGASGPA
jgi:hypothetical protein